LLTVFLTSLRGRRLLTSAPFYLPVVRGNVISTKRCNPIELSSIYQQPLRQRQLKLYSSISSSICRSTLRKILHLNSIYCMSARVTTRLLTQNLRSTPRLIQIHSQLSPTSFKPTALRTMATSIPKTMKGVLIEKTGGVEVLEYKTDLPVPSPQEGEVLVKNDFIGINYIDTYAPFPLKPPIRALTNTS
jgi:hypothetical protein